MKSIVSTLCRQVSSLEQKNVGLERELASVSAAQASSAASVASKGRRGVAGKASDNQSTSLPSAADSPSTDFADGMSADLSTKVSENSSKIRKNAGALIKHTSDIQSAQSSIESNSRSIGVQDVQLSDLSLRLDIVDVKTTNGVLVWKIGDISRRRREAISGKTPSLYSAPFYTSPCGYKMCARVYLDGDGMGKGGCISVFFVIMRGEYDALLLWPFQLRVTMMLIDQSDSVVKRNITEVFKPDGRSASFKRPKNEMNTGSGCPMFASVNVLDSPTYVKDDIIFIKVIADKASTHFVPPDHDRQ
ncbi:TNF receptor-associated factor 3-like [Sycon ciliatum]|uniref:TNF receptor-associated factor 3-like n=1 Tax=Sycon ciliatum TaxID=27933 RepID=UPI0020A8C4B0